LASIPTSKQPNGCVCRGFGGAGSHLEQSRSGLDLSRPSSRPLACNDHAAIQQLASPDPPWLAPAKSPAEALDTNWTGPTESLGLLDNLRLLREEQLRGVKAGELTAMAGEVLNNRQQH
jgi:hypothetical protein